MGSLRRKERRRLERERRRRSESAQDDAVLDLEFDDPASLPQPSGSPREHVAREYIPGMHREDTVMGSLRRAPSPAVNQREQLAALADQVERDLAEIPEQGTPEIHDSGSAEPADVPVLVQVVRHESERDHDYGYEETNWAKLSPTFRAAHNRLRQLRGMSPLPPPAIDLYRPPLVKRADPAELAALQREANTAKAQFLGGGLMSRGPEGFTINGEPVKF